MVVRWVRRFAIGTALALAVSGVMLGSGGLFAAQYSGGDVAEVDIYPTQIVWTPVIRHDAVQLTVSGPNGINETTTYAAGATPTFLAGGHTDGAYTYELTVTPPLSPGTKERMRTTTDPEARAALFDELIASGELSETAATQSGGFTVQGGQILGSSYTAVSDQDGGLVRDVAHLDDVYITGALCVGGGCVDGEDPNFVSIKMKEDNVRLIFEDTSTASGFPARDWQITANDSGNGGAEYLAFDDLTAGRQPFRVGGNAPNNSLVVEASTGDVGIGTAAPAVELHVVDGDSPAVRLEQNNSSGFTPQAWDVAGNETNFFVRDVTNGSTLPFKIQPGAATNSVFIRAGGNVMFGGAATPSAQIEVRSDTNDVAKFTNQTDQTSAVQISVVQGDPDEPKVEFITPEGTWSVGIDGATNHMVFQNASTDLMTIDHKTREVVFAGGVTANGGVMHASDADRKEAFAEVDTEALLQRALDLRIASWQYKWDAEQVRHIGPTAQDFAAAFGVGGDDKYINTVDADGIALGAIQGLNARLIKALDERDARIAELEARIAAIEADK